MTEVTHSTPDSATEPAGYDPAVVEKKWQTRWEERGTNDTDLRDGARPFYALMMFPYPSAEGLHVGNLFCLMHVGNMPKEKCMYSTKLFAEKVMPKMRGMFPEYENDERFWCHPIKQVKAGNLPTESKAFEAVGAAR